MAWAAGSPLTLVLSTCCIASATTPGSLCDESFADPQRCRGRFGYEGWLGELQDHDRHRLGCGNAPQHSQDESPFIVSLRRPQGLFAHLQLLLRREFHLLRNADVAAQGAHLELVAWQCVAPA